MLARLQCWLQGYPNGPDRPWAIARVGNWISDGRYWSWRLTRRLRKDARSGLNDIDEGALTEAKEIWPDLFDEQPTVGYCSRCGEARQSVYTCRDGGHTVAEHDTTSGGTR